MSAGQIGVYNNPNTNRNNALFKIPFLTLLNPDSPFFSSEDECIKAIPIPANTTKLVENTTPTPKTTEKPTVVTTTKNSKFKNKLD